MRKSMEFIAEINQGTPPFTYNDWDTEINNNPNLIKRSAQRRGINPFTGEPIVFKSAPGNADIIKNGEPIGFISRSQVDTSLLVESDSSAVDAVFEIAREVAENLGGFVAPPTSMEP